LNSLPTDVYNDFALRSEISDHPVLIIAASTKIMCRYEGEKARREWAEKELPTFARDRKDLVASQQAQMAKVALSDSRWQQHPTIPTIQHPPLHQPNNSTSHHNTTYTIQRLTIPLSTSSSNDHPTTSTVLISPRRVLGWGFSYRTTELQNCRAAELQELRPEPP
jgi:hypothetical protein